MCKSKLQQKQVTKGMSWDESKIAYHIIIPQQGTNEGEMWGLHIYKIGRAL